jgi:hypothetical protein
MITVTVQVDEERQRQSGAPEQSEEEIRGLLETMQAEGRLRLESLSYWVPVKGLRIRGLRSAR